MKKKKRKLTLKQRRFLKELPTAKSQTEAALKAGYSPSCAKEVGSENLSKSNVKEALIDALEKHGLTENKIAQTLAEGLDSTTLFFFGSKMIGRLTESAMEKLSKMGIGIAGDDFLDIPDRYARHKYLDTLCKLKGHPASKEDEKPTVNVNIYLPEVKGEMRNVTNETSSDYKTL